jgi:hypothetical protein
VRKASCVLRRYLLICHIVTYVRIRTVRKRMMRTGRDILVVGNMGARKRLIDHDEWQPCLAESHTESRHECSAFPQIKTALVRYTSDRMGGFVGERKEEKMEV